MAEILPTNGNDKRKKYRSKKTIRVDLTPMVDLGFILITFFVFTSVLSEPRAMDLLTPNDKDEQIQDEVCESCVLTLVLGRENSIYYFEGKDRHPNYKKLEGGAVALRKLIIEKKNRVMKTLHSDRMVLIIRPSDKTPLHLLVDAIDEATIGMVKRYYLDECSTGDLDFLKTEERKSQK